MRTMHTFVSKTKGDPLKLLFLGTHRDSCTSVSQKRCGDKNKRLKKADSKEVCQSGDLGHHRELIFEMNALKPDHLRQEDGQSGSDATFGAVQAHQGEAARAWLAFEEKLRSIAERLGRMGDESAGVLEGGRVTGAGGELFRRCLGPLPRMLLDKVSELVEFMFELREPEEEDESSDDTKPEEKTHTRRWREDNRTTRDHQMPAMLPSRCQILSS
ncbi:hypothetical protein GBAR_LOCUS12695, partial [Geodia barretti]